MSSTVRSSLGSSIFPAFLGRRSLGVGHPCGPYNLQQRDDPYGSWGDFNVPGLSGRDTLGSFEPSCGLSDPGLTKYITSSTDSGSRDFLSAGIPGNQFGEPKPREGPKEDGHHSKMPSSKYLPGLVVKGGSDAIAALCSPLTQDGDHDESNSFASPSSLIVNRVHEVEGSGNEDDKTYACNLCDRKFKRRCHTYDHIRRVHDGIRPYRCGSCDRTFPQKSTRDRHIQVVHQKQKPFKCTDCGKSFGKRNALTVHTRTVHLRLRPYGCEICKTKFGVKSHLNKHMKIVHSM